MMLQSGAGVVGDSFSPDLGKDANLAGPSTGQETTMPTLEQLSDLQAGFYEGRHPQPNAAVTAAI